MVLKKLLLEKILKDLDSINSNDIKNETFFPNTIYFEYIAYNSESNFFNELLKPSMMVELSSVFSKDIEHLFHE